MSPRPLFLVVALVILAVAGGCIGGPTPSRVPARSPSEAGSRPISPSLDRVLAPQADLLAAEYLGTRPSGALVIGVHHDGGNQVYGYGTLSGKSVSPDRSTVFEIGSVTKVFTAILLARLVGEGVVSLDDPISRFLPLGTFPEGDARGAITLGQLSTHASGLPRLPGNFNSVLRHDPRDPYAEYTRAHLEADLREVSLVHPAGTKIQYSNYGAALLGDILARAAGQNYQELVTEKVITPLGLIDTAFSLETARAARLAPPHGPTGESTSSWNFDVFAPAGGLRSTPDDLLGFIRENLDPADTAIGRALRLAQEIHTPKALSAGGLGWQISGGAENTVWWHNGGTGGYSCFLAVDRANRAGVFVLSNHGDAMAGKFDVDRIGGTLLRALQLATLE